RGKPTLDSPAVVDSMKFAQYLAHEAKIMPEEVTSSLVTTLFSKGQAAMAINGPWFIGEIGRGVDYRVAPLPNISGKGPARPFLTAEGVIMSARSDHKKEAFEAMAFLTGNEAAKIMATVGRQTTARKDAYAHASIGKDPLFVAFRKQLENSAPMPNTPAMRMVWSPVTTAMNKIINGKAEPAAAMAKAQTEVTQVLHGARR
ncbi:MAG: extracellular solute-binding protein, partial [Myxococcota bacterium]